VIDTARRLRLVLSNGSRIWGGAELQTERLVRGLTGRGHDVVLFCRSGGPLAEKLGHEFRCDPLLGGADMSPLGIARGMTALRRYRPHVLMTMTTHDPRTAGVAARLLRIPVVIRQAYEAEYSRSLRHRIYYQWVPEHYIANARATADAILRSATWLDGTAITVIHNGIDMAAGGVQPADLGIPAGAVAVGYVGRIEHHKGMRDLAHAWPRVAAAVPDAHLLIAGAGSREEELRNALAEAPRVHWLGFRDDPIAVIRALDVLVHPSHVEGMPNAIMEAMAAGTAVVACAASGIPELVRDGVTGRLVPPASPELLADALTEVAGDAALRTAMGAAGAKRVAEEFTLETMLDRYEALLRKVAAGASSRGS
jgi:glycosyltransferase involved in cell wall biosynthesis